MPTSPAPLEILERLIAFPTVSRDSNLPLADYLAGLLDRPGVTVARHFDATGEKANLLVVVGERLDPAAVAAGRPGLTLSGHTDVVPADEEGWESDPFTLTARDGDGGRLYGRGTSDMKGFLAVATAVAARLDPASLAAPLALVFTYDEEVGTLGARHLAESWAEVEPEVGALPTAAVIGEPTGLAAVRLHKGHLKMRLVFRGESAHSGYPHLGTNAIEAAGRAVAALTALRAELAGERPETAVHFPEVPFVPLNLGRVDGGVAVNVVPDRCVVELGARALPGMDDEELARRLRRTVAEACPDDDYTLEVSASPPLLTRREAPVHRALVEILGQDDGDRSVSFATDAGWLQHLGLDCAICGPGSIEVAHRPNEHVPRDDLARAEEVVTALVDRFCRARPGGADGGSGG